MNQQDHIVTDNIKNNSINILKSLNLCGFLWRYDDTPVVEKKPILASMCNHVLIGSAVFVLMKNQESRVCITYNYIQGRHRIFGILFICYVLFLDRITYDHAYSTLWHHVVLYVDRKFQWCKLCCITKHFNIFVHNIKILLHVILPLCSLLFTWPFLSALINYSVFVWCIIQAFL